MNTTENAKYFRYLFELQESGDTNMWGAQPYLLREFRELNNNSAKEIHLHWIKNYSKLKKELYGD